MARRLEFGINIDPGAGRIALGLDLSRSADRLGLEYIGVQDHPYRGGYLDTFVYSPAVGQEREQLRLFAEDVVPGVRERLGQE